jgi:hypothetical protein
MTIEGVRPRAVPSHGLAGRIDVAKCHDAGRAQVLSDLQQVPRMHYEVTLPTDGLHLLFKLACAPKERVRLSDMKMTGGSREMPSEAIEAVVARGWVERRLKKLELTDAGNAMVRRLLEFARGDGRDA